MQPWRRQQLQSYTSCMGVCAWVLCSTQHAAVRPLKAGCSCREHYIKHVYPAECHTLPCLMVEHEEDKDLNYQ